MPEFLNPLGSPGGRPYSTLVKAGGLVFVSGQSGTDRETDKLAPGGIRAETQQALRNILKLLETQSLGAGDIVKTTVFLVNIEDFAEMNAAYREMFDDHFPARSTVAVYELPARGALVEIEAIAALH